MKREREGKQEKEKMKMVVVVVEEEYEEGEVLVIWRRKVYKDHVVLQWKKRRIVRLVQ